MKKSRRHASVLIVVLWVCLGLVAMTLLFGESMSMSYRGAGNDLAAHQADAAINGALVYAESLIENADTPGLFPDSTTYVAEEAPIGDATFWFLGGTATSSVVGSSSTSSLTSQSAAYGLVDEASKISLNHCSAEMLEALPGMTPDIASAIVQWSGQDAGDSAASGGIGAYPPKAAPFESVEELALVSGVDHDLLYGEDANLNSSLDPNEDDGETNPPSDNRDGKLDPGILAYVTAFTREPNTKPDGSPRNRLPSPNGSVLEMFANRSPDEFDQQAYNYAKNPSARYVTGLVNVNTASETVLACIPGIDADKAAALIAARASRSSTDVGYGWVIPILGPDGCRLAGPYLTGRSFQMSADIAAVGPHGRGYRRTRFVIDSSTGLPRVIYRRDLGGLGWALGPEVRQSFANGGNSSS